MNSDGHRCEKLTPTLEAFGPDKSPRQFTVCLEEAREADGILARSWQRGVAGGVIGELSLEIFT